MYPQAHRLPLCKDKDMMSLYITEDIQYPYVTTSSWDVRTEFQCISKHMHAHMGYPFGMTITWDIPMSISMPTSLQDHLFHRARQRPQRHGGRGQHGQICTLLLFVLLVLQTLRTICRAYCSNSPVTRRVGRCSSCGTRTTRVATRARAAMKCAKTTADCATMSDTVTGRVWRRAS